MDNFSIRNFAIFFLICVLISFVKYSQAEDLPCAARKIPNRSVICVCNDTYCDTITRQPPTAGQFVMYTSSESGLRFQKTTGLYKERVSCRRCTTYEIDVTTKYQTIVGFGGAVTDAASMNWKTMSKQQQQYFIDSYFSEQGLQYNVLRVPIAGSDFSTHGYAYNELPVDDVKLTNFSLTVEDSDFKIPLIKAAFEASSTNINILANIWSPPAWMKTNNNLSGIGLLKREYYQTLADYHCKFIEQYGKEGIPVWAITPSNEPSHGLTDDTKYVCLGWTPCGMGEYITNYLGDTIRKCTNNAVKILALDDTRNLVDTWWKWFEISYPEALDYIDGLAVHFYADMTTSPSILSNFSKHHPDKVILATEACQGFGQEIVVDVGSWERAKVYALDIISNLLHDVTGWLDWNLALNEQGGPNYAQNFADAPVIVVADKNEFYKQPMFYALGHFAKFIPRGSLRIKSTPKSMGVEVSVTEIQSVALLTPLNTVVFVGYNENSRAKTIVLKIGAVLAELKLPPNSITTVELPYDGAATK